MAKNMKTFIVCASLLLTALIYTVAADWDDYDDRPCISDEDCSYNDCCVEDPRSADGRKSCQDRGDDRGEPCGGRYFCGCEARYHCVPFVAPPVRRLRGYYHLANGTCERDVSFYNDINGPRQDRRRDDSDSDERDGDWDDDRRR